MKNLFVQDQGVIAWNQFLFQLFCISSFLVSFGEYGISKSLYASNISKLVSFSDVSPICQKPYFKKDFKERKHFESFCVKSKPCY